MAASTSYGKSTCSFQQEVCFHNPDHRIGGTHTGIQSPQQCCELCGSTSGCKAYTAWKSRAGTQEALSCNLFSTAGPREPGNCTSGENPNSPKRMNFVFMYPDTMRAESFSSYGHPLNVTPNLDAFAQTAVQFDQCHVAHTQCSPSRATMLTGRYMHVLGHRTQTHLVQSYEYNYFQILKENGYHIEYYGKNDVFSPDAMNTSVSYWEGDIGVQSGPNAFEFPESGYYSMLSKGSNVAKNDTSNADYRAVLKGINFLKGEAAKNNPTPFLLFLPGRGAHPPYGSPMEFHKKWDIETIKSSGRKLRPPYGESKPRYHSKTDGVPHYRNLTYLEEDTFYSIQSAYLGMISYNDWIFGQLLKGVEESGLSHNTAIIYSSDHGDFAGDFHMIEKWPGGADDVLTRVPLYMRIPGGAQGFVSKAPVQSLDIPHTMCLLAGIYTQIN